MNSISKMLRLFNKTSLILSILVLFLVTDNAFGTMKVSLVNDPYPPYVLGHDTSYQISPGGITVNIAKEIFSHIDNAEVEVYLLPWKRALRGVKSGLYDGFPMLLKSEERLQYFDYTIPIMKARTVLFYNKNKFPNGITWNSYKDLVQYKIAVQANFNINDKFKEQIRKGIPLNIYESITDEKSFQLLEFERVDLVATNEVFGKELIKKQQLQHMIISTQQALYEKPFYIAFSKKTEARLLIPKINQIIKELKQKGIIQKIIDNN